jgi:acyl-CoA hydrolase
MTWIVMPTQTNALGTVFGGQVMAWIDVAAAVSAQRFCRSDVVTASMDSLVFRAPAHQGDVVVLRAAVNWAGTTSMEIGVRVESEDVYTGQRQHTASAFLTFVALDRNKRKRRVPRLLCETDDERTRCAAAERRRAQRLALRPD